MNGTVLLCSTERKKLDIEAERPQTMNMSKEGKTRDQMDRRIPEESSAGRIKAPKMLEDQKPKLASILLYVFDKKSAGQSKLSFDQMATELKIPITECVRLALILEERSLLIADTLRLTMTGLAVSVRLQKAQVKNEAAA